MKYNHLFLAGLVWIGVTGAAVRADEPESYMRVVEVDATTAKLEIAARRFVPAHGAGPTIWLTGVIHIAEPDYYTTLQKHLDAQDRVLFESVGWPPFADPRPATDGEDQLERTKTAQRYIAERLERYKAEHNAYPKTLDELAASLDPDEQKMAIGLLRAARSDGWGRPMRYAPADDDYDIISLGADGKTGGQALNADVHFADQPPLTAAEIADSHNLQSTIATALKLVFQLDSINYDRPTFINSDIPMRKLADAVSESGGGDPEMRQLMKTLDGTSMLAGIVQFGLKLVAMSPKFQSMGRLVLIEMLGRLKGDISTMAGLPPSMQELMRRLVHDRNKIVISDLRETLAEADPPQTISVFYGAGHMHDLQNRLEDELGYRPAETVWYPAITENAKAAGLTKQDVEVVRGLIKYQFYQMKMMQQARDAAEAGH
ncbi:hypothetical protein HED60_18795 [Planctomycetales bacterium ZRK34]|nr:hypothetical protein HED60_18795 [Planctomycetales bacterium ZRK34]